MKNLKSGWLVSRLRFAPGTSKIWSWSENHFNITFSTIIFYLYYHEWIKVHQQFLRKCWAVGISERIDEGWFCCYLQFLYQTFKKRSCNWSCKTNFTMLNSQKTEAMYFNKVCDEHLYHKISLSSTFCLYVLTSRFLRWGSHILLSKSSRYCLVKQPT